MSDYYPLVTIAAELNIGLRDLLGRANGAVQLDGNGIRVIPAALVRELVAERDARLAAQLEREAANRAERDVRAAEHKRWTDAIKQRGKRQRELVTQGLTAAQVVMLDAGEHERRADASPTGDYLRGGDPHYRPISEKRK